MSYLMEKVVLPNESVKVKPEKNPIFLILKWVWGVLGFWLLLIPTYYAVKATIEYKTTEYLVTDKRVLEKYGWISTHTDDMPLGKIENVTVDYTFFGKIFNYGTVRIEGANFNDIEFTDIKNAEEIKKAVTTIMYAEEKE